MSIFFQEFREMTKNVDTVLHSLTAFKRIKKICEIPLLYFNEYKIIFLLLNSVVSSKNDTMKTHIDLFVFVF